MNSQDFRSLQEAYMEVYRELDEVLDTPQKTQSYAAKNAASAVGAFVRGDTKTLSKRFEGAKRGMKKIEKRKEQKEQTDLYDIILSHLLDEGYAETQEAAQAIMVNMGEEWRESICEELTGERKKRALEKGGYLANRVASGKEGQPLERINRSGDVTMRTTKKGPTKRGGMGFKGKTKSDWYGTDDAHGYANKSRRRRGIEVKDTSDDL
jgi:hypothetical protein